MVLFPGFYNLSISRRTQVNSAPKTDETLEILSALEATSRTHLRDSKVSKNLEEPFVHQWPAAISARYSGFQAEVLQYVEHFP